jgi:hypothetical protein
MLRIATRVIAIVPPGSQQIGRTFKRLLLKRLLQAALSFNISTAEPGPGALFVIGCFGYPQQRAYGAAAPSENSRMRNMSN